VEQVQQGDQTLALKLAPGISYDVDEQIKIYGAKGGSLGQIQVQTISSDALTGRYQGSDLERIETGTELRAEFGIQVVSVMLSAVRPYKVWLIVILVSFISFVGYVLVKVFGSSSGIGLTDADAIAFSVSDAQQDGLISLDWAAFNAVLGAIANTFMKLMLVYSLGDKGLFKKLIGPVVIIGIAGLGSAFIYYDFSAPA